MSDVVVIGGDSGIGLRAARLLRSNGEMVWAYGRHECDVRVGTDVCSVVSYHRDAPLWVYSAGVNRLSFIENQEEEDAIDQYDVNVIGFLRFMKELKRHRPKDAQTSVVVVGSDAAERPMRTSAVYCGSKAALHMSVKALARELAPQFRINAVAPGMTEPTRMQEYIDKTVPLLRGWTEEEALRYEQSQIPMGRRGTTTDVAHVMVDLLFGPHYMTGSIVTINGGR